MKDPGAIYHWLTTLFFFVFLCTITELLNDNLNTFMLLITEISVPKSIDFSVIAEKNQ